jgi:acylphosphatase
MMHICNQFIVSGKVQGVFFRASTRDQAIRLGLSGWVRNLSNGDVELLAYGDRESIEELGQWLWHGPQFAKVTEVKSVRLSGNSFDTVKGFEVRGDG